MFSKSTDDVWPVIDVLHPCITGLTPFFPVRFVKVTMELDKYPWKSN